MCSILKRKRKLYLYCKTTYKEFIKNSSQHPHSLDLLERFVQNNVTYEFLDHLINELISDKLLIFIKQSSKLKSIEDDLFLEVKKSKVANLVKLRENEVFPSDFTHCLIANHVYFFVQQEDTNDIHKISGYSRKRILNELFFRFYKKYEDEKSKNNKYCNIIWQVLEKENWEIYEILRLKGYQSIIYINEIKKQIILAYQGFKFNFNDFFFVGDNHDSYLKYINSLFDDNDLILNQLLAVYIQVSKVFNLSQKLNYTLSFTSYSFGSIFCDLSLFILNRYFNSNNAKSVTFESVGSYDLLNKLNNKLNAIDLSDLDINTYLLKPTLFNTFQQHLGTIYFFTSALANLKTNKKESLDLVRNKINQNSNISQEKKVFFLNSIESLRATSLKDLLTELKNDSSEIRETQKWPILSYKTNDSDHFHSSARHLRKRNQKIFQKYFKIEISKDYLHSLNLIYSELKSVLCFTFRSLNRPEEYPMKYFFNHLNILEIELFDLNLIKMSKELICFSSKKTLELKKKFETEILKISKKLQALKNSNYKSENLTFLTDLVIRNIDSIKRSIKSNVLVNIYNYLDQKDSSPIILWLFENNFENTYFELKRLARKFNINFKQSRKEITKEIQNALNIKYKKFDFFILTSESLHLEDFLKGLGSNSFIFKLNQEWLNYNGSFDISSSSFDNRNCLISKFLEYNFNNLEYDSAERGYHSQHLNNFIKLLLKRNFHETKDLSQINHLMKFYFDLLTFVRFENKRAFDFMFYLCHLDSNNINFKLLRNIFNLTDNFQYYDFENNLLNYLIEVSFITKLNGDKYLLNEYYKNEFLNRINISYDYKTNIMNKIVSALVDLIVSQDNSLLSLNDIEIFYKQFNVIKNIDWFLKQSNSEYQQLVEIADYIDRNYSFEMISFDQFQKIELNNINELISNKIKEELNLISDCIEDAKLSIIDLENFLNGLEVKLFDRYSDLINEIQLRKELRINALKVENDFGEDEDESNLSNSLKSEIHELDNLSEILINEIEKYRNNDSEKLNSLKKETFNQIGIINDYLIYLSENCDNNNVLDNLFERTSKIDLIKNILNEINDLKCVDPSDIITNIKIETSTRINNPLGEISINQVLCLTKENYLDFETETKYLKKPGHVNQIIFLPGNRIFFDYKIKIDELRFNSFASIYNFDGNSVEKTSQIHFVYKQWLNIDNLNRLCLNCYKDTFVYDYNLNKVKKIEDVLIKGSSESSFYGIHCNTNFLREFDLELNEIKPNARLDQIIRDINRSYMALYLHIEHKSSRFILNLNLYTHYRQLNNNCLVKVFNNYGQLIFEFDYIDSCSIFYGLNLQIVDLKLENEKKYYEIRHFNYNGNLVKKVTLDGSVCNTPDDVNTTFDLSGNLILFRSKN